MQKYPGKCTVYPFLPSIEQIKENAVLPDHPNRLLKNTRRIPVMMGMTEKEGANMFFKGDISSNTEFIANMKQIPIIRKYFQNPIFLE